METGPCRGNFSRWHFDKESGECQPFGWGGCKGNENNFLSERECQMRCKDQPGRMRGKSNNFAAKKIQIHFCVSTITGLHSLGSTKHDIFVINFVKN